MKSIIFGTDFTDNAARAGRVAAAIAERLNDTLLVVHSTEAGLRDAFPFTEEAFAKFEAAKEDVLQKAAAGLKRDNLSIQTELLGGEADEAIAKKTSTESTRLVVVASMGHRTADRWKLGSVAERLAEASPVPTLVVRQEEALVAWAQQQKPLKVLCAYDFSGSADAALAYLKELRHIGPCEIVVAHVDWPLGEMSRLGISGSTPLDANRPEVQAALERDLKARVAAITGEKDVSIRVSPGLGRSEFHLIEIAEQEQAHLIVTGTHQRHGLTRLWHASTSRGLLHHAPMSVLVVPTTAVSVRTIIPQIRRVLVTTDLSDLGNLAISHACALLQSGGSLHLLHVLLPGQSGLSEQLYGARKPSEMMDDGPTKDCLEQLRSLIPAEAQALGLTVEVEVCEHPSTAEAICQTAERLAADVICMSTHGRTGLASAIVGSVANSVLARSKRPLHLVRTLDD
jgi:nucleotide-binding universal stress UspA family protein